MSMLNKQVIIRSTNSGVHYGTLTSLEGQQATLINSRRIWWWKGAFTLSAIATKGVHKESKLSVPVPEILINEVIEVIPTSNEADLCIAGIEAHLE